MASLLSNIEHRNQEATVYVGNLDAACTEELLMELFTQVGPVVNVHMPKDKLRYVCSCCVCHYSQAVINIMLLKYNPKVTYHSSDELLLMHLVILVS